MPVAVLPTPTGPKPLGRLSMVNIPEERTPGRGRTSVVSYAEEDRGYGSQCWIWQGALNYKGYGLLVLKGKLYRAHRYYYERQNGGIPKGLQIDHLCWQRACVNPAHMEVVTPSEHNRRHSRTRFTLEIAREIRAFRRQGISASELGERYGVTKQYINRIVSEALWREAGSH